MEDEINPGDLEKSLRDFANQNNMKIASYEQCRDAFNFYHKTPLNKIVNEELPKIIEEDPSFFEKYGIDLPENHELHLFELYFEKQGREGLRRASYSAGLWFDHLHLYMKELPEELDHAIEEYKKAIDGTYFDED